LASAGEDVAAGDGRLEPISGHRAYTAKHAASRLGRMQAELDRLRESNETLKRLLSEREAEIARRDEQLAAARGELLVTTTLIEKLKLQIARLKRMQFGRSSEKTAQRIEQLELIVEDLEASQAQIDTLPRRGERAPAAARAPRSGRRAPGAR